MLVTSAVVLGAVNMLWFEGRASTYGFCATLLAAIPALRFEQGGRR